MTSNSRFQQRTFYLGIAISVALTITSCSNSPEHEKSPVAVKKESPKEITPPPAEPILKPIVSQPAAATPLSINENTKNFIRKMVALHHFNEQELTQ
ncbi:MAG: hypothetical protein J0649_10625, partial [Methylococcales bacterium]|nr:hypothetical protein [Methylococcales bacterium]